MSKSITTTYYNGNDLQQTKPIFELMPLLAIIISYRYLAAYFTVYSDSYNVGQNEQDPKDQTQAPAREPCRPVLQDQLQGHQIRGHGYGIVEPIIPSQGEPKGIIDKPTNELST